jgi:tetratricopeptide (TPR) repeat protein
MNKKDYESAIDLLRDLNFQDSEELVKQCKYTLGKELYDSKDYENTLTYLEKLNYQDSEIMVDYINNNPYSINKFVERYYTMTDVLYEREGVAIDKLSVDNVKENQIKTGTGAIVFFNKSSENIDCQYEIVSFMWDKTGWVFADANKILADWYCCVAGFNSDITYDTAGEILTSITDNAGEVYGSTQYGDAFYNTSKSKKELTMSGRRN